ncbi:MAG: AAA family ATPase [Armatimonadetes bacterium]|nr:AAA family ATPase [Armatimonadota bacterium]MDW8029800.1 AAA family ATPase [Armatimonadota bacterium]
MAESVDRATLRILLAGLEILGLESVDNLPILIVGRIKPSDGQEALAESSLTLAPHFVFVNGDETNFDGLELAQMLREQKLPTTVVLFTEKFQDENFLRVAALAGVEEVLPKEATSEQICQMIRDVISSPRGQQWKLVIAPEKVEEKVESKVIALSSGKGGVGKTTLIVNLAIALSEETKDSVALLDLFIGDTLALVNGTAKMTLSEIPEAVREIDLELLRPYAVRHESGAHFYTWFFSPERNLPEYIDIERLEAVLKALRQGYRFVLVDTPLTLYVPDLELLKLMDEVLVVAVPWDLLSLRATKALTLGMKKWDVTPKLLFNRVQADADLTPSYIASQIGLDVFDIIPNDSRAVVQSVNIGEPIVISNPESEVSKAIRRVAKRLAGLPVEEPKKRKFLFFG